jgi:CBS domain-containing protein
MKASDIMTAHEVWACVDTSDARHVATLMLEHDVGSIPVLDKEGRLEGIVTDRDLCCRMIAQGRGFETPICDLMTEPALSVHPDTGVIEIESLMRHHKIRRLPVCDDDRMLLGYVSLSDLALHCEGAKAEHQVFEVLETVCTPG